MNGRTSTSILLITMRMVWFVCFVGTALSAMASPGCGIEDTDSLAFYQAQRRLDSLIFEERCEGPPNPRILYLLGQYQDCLLRFLHESEDEEKYLQGMQELFFRSAKVHFGSFYSIDKLRYYRFTYPELKSQTVTVNYKGHHCEAFYNTFKNNAILSSSQRTELFRMEQLNYQRDAIIPPRQLDESSLTHLQPETIYNFVLLPNDTVWFAEERLGPREYHVGNDEEITEKFTHPNHTILAGAANQAVITAGAFSFYQQDGKRLYFVSNKSGHFRPFLYSLAEFRDWLARHGVDEAIVVLLPDVEMPRTLIENWDPIYLGRDPEYHQLYYTNYGVGIPLSIDKEQAVHLLDLAQRRWLNLEQAIDRKLIATLATGDTSVLTPEAKDALYQGREQLNLMRCAYTLLLQNHKAPVAFDRLCKRYGKLKDAILHQVPERIVIEANKLLLLLNANSIIPVIDEEHVIDEASFYDFISQKIERMRELIATVTLHAPYYHTLKKETRDLAVLFTLLEMGNSSIENEGLLTHRAAADAFNTLHEEMREVYDQYVGDKMHGRIKGEVCMTLPTKLCNQLKRYLEYISPIPPILDLALTQQSADTLLFWTHTIWSCTHENLLLKDGIRKALGQLAKGEPVEVTPTLEQWLVISKKAADVMARTCNILEANQASPDGVSWYIDQIDTILAVIPHRTYQTICLPIETTMPLTQDKLVTMLTPRKSLSSASAEQIAQSLHHIVDSIRLLTHEKVLAYPLVDTIQDHATTLAALVDMFKKTIFKKVHRYEVYDYLARAISGLLAQLDYDLQQHRANPTNTVDLSPETQRLARRVSSLLSTY